MLLTMVHLNQRVYNHMEDGPICHSRSYKSLRKRSSFFPWQILFFSQSYHNNPTDVNFFAEKTSVADPWHFGRDPDQHLWLKDPDPAPDPAFSSLTFKTPPKSYFFTFFFAFYYRKVHLHHFSKIKSLEKSQKSRNQSFSYYFWLTIGSGFMRPKNIRILWIQIRFLKTEKEDSQTRRDEQAWV